MKYNLELDQTEFQALEELLDIARRHGNKIHATNSITFSNRHIMAYNKAFGEPVPEEKPKEEDKKE